MRRIIVNADDFGLTPGVNRGIHEAAIRGVVSSTSLIANSLAFNEAAELASKDCHPPRPSLSVGCHVVLLDGRPVLDPSLVPSLLSREDPTQFRFGFTEFGLSAIRRKVSSAEIETEATAQIRKLQATGVKLSHVDTHKHSHLFPVVMRPLIQAAKKCGIYSIRNPFYPNKFPNLAAIRKNRNLIKRYAQIPLLKRFELEFRRVVIQEGMRTTDGCIGVYEPALVDVETLREVLRRVPPGTWELVCHPGYVDPALDAVKTRLRGSRVKELELLTSEAVSNLFASEGFEQISYWQL